MDWLFPLSSVSSDAAGRPLLVTLIALTLALAALTVAIGVAIVWLRLSQNLAEPRRERFRARWEPLLFEAMTGPVPPPQLAARERIAFLELWNAVQRHIREEEAENLNRLARAMGLQADAIRLLTRRTLGSRLLAVRVLSRLKEPSAWPALEKAARSPVPALSLLAAHALVRLDAARAVPLILPVLRRASHWAPAALVRILDDAGSHARAALLGLFNEAGPGELKYLFRLLHITQNTEVLPLLRIRLPRSEDPEEIGEILHALGRLGGAEDRTIVQRHLTHPHWVVRLKAAQALGSMGFAEDDLKLLPLLSDREWWVRYRAAQSLARLPGVSLSRLRIIRESQSDRYARDILTQVLAEQETT